MTFIKRFEKQPDNLFFSIGWISIFFCISVLISLNNAYAAASSIETSAAEPDKVSYKLITSYYSASDKNNAVDINLRAKYAEHTGWLGEYGNKQGFRQFRVGYEYSPDFVFIRPTFSLQLASKGFIGESINTEIGGKTFAILGIGRTNLHDYYNLNFDPNDAVTIGIGTRVFDQHQLSLIQVFDNRLNTHQRINHFIWHYNPTDSQHFSIDASYKSGIDSDNVMIHGYGISADYRYDQYFIRLAHEQHANFAVSDLTRFSLGLHF